jgi:hypothetical protein
LSRAARDKVAGGFGTKQIYKRIVMPLYRTRCYENRRNAC